MPSLRSRIMRIALKRWAERSFDTSAPIERTRAVLDQFAKRAPMPRRVDVEPITVGERYAEWLRPSGVQQDRAILYLHGGGYVMGSCDASRALASRIAKEAATCALLLDYRLAPEHPYPAALEDVQAAYRWLIEQGILAHQIAVIGESAGGGLGLAMLLVLRDKGETLSAAAVCMSPYTDLAATGESVQTRAAVDPWIKPRDFPITAAMYIGDGDPCHPYVSPLYGDLHDLPPLLIHVGDHEVMLSDSTDWPSALKPPVSRSR
jgi:monoterpene epsilon-lactone hydrolase